MSSPSRALDGVHGVHLVPRSPFTVHEISRNGDCNTSTFEGSETIGAAQGLLISPTDVHISQFLQPAIAGQYAYVSLKQHFALSFVGGRRYGLGRIMQPNVAAETTVPEAHTLLSWRYLKIAQSFGDQSISETIANVLTSLPFIVLGIQAPRKNLNCILYANSLIGVGIASSLYHSSRGEIRKYLRWADYTMIATTTVCLSRALRNENPKLLMAASALVLPFQPLMVSAIHTGMLEVAFARRALRKPELRTAHTLHKMSSLLGGMLFVADDLFPQTPYLHAAWHLAAAVGVGTCNKLL
ncbi:hypothetical protein ACLOJK_007293 [Asimina triloba]